MPSGTPSAAASTKPPSTRQIVMPTSFANPNCANSVHPSRSIVSGSARNVFETKPPNVAMLQPSTYRTKNATPSATLRVPPTGSSGFIATRVPAGRGVAAREDAMARTQARRPRAGRATPATLLDESRIVECVHVRHRLDAANLQQQVARFLAELLQFAVEEFLVRRLVLPAQVFRRCAELLAALLDVGAHDFIAFGRVLLDHRHCLEVAVGERL